MRKFLFYFSFIFSIICLGYANPVDALIIGDPEVTGIEYVSDSSVKILYKTNNTNTDYKVQIYNMTSGKYYTNTIPSDSYTLTGLTTGTTYNIILRVYYKTTVSNWSKPISATPKEGVPVINSVTAGDKQLTLNYNANGSPKEIEIYISNIKKSVKTSNLSTATLTGLTNGTTYSFMMRGCYSNGKYSPWSESFSGVPKDSSTPTPTPATSKVDDVVETYFLNTLNASGMSTIYDANESIIVKTKDGKYILIDTGNSDSKIASIIYNKLKSCQGKDSVVIDYLIISHFDPDHWGNVVSIINKSNIKVKNVILKEESKTLSRYKEVVAAAKKEKATIIVSNNLSEGKGYAIGSYLKMYLYNVKDVYKGDPACKDYSALRFTANINSDRIIKYNKKYIYFDGSTFPKITLEYADKLTTKSNGSGINRYFYAYKYDSNTCRRNTNSIAILMSVQTSGKRKYMYLPNDLENSGYPIYGSSDIYGNNGTYHLSDYKISNGKFANVSKNNNKIASENKIAKSIKKKIVETDKNTLNDIVIYQQSHHGYNNALDAIKILNLNRKEVYSVAMCKTDPKSSTNFLKAVSYHYTLKNANNFYTGGTTKKGVYCTIKSDGTYNCENY